MEGRPGPRGRTRIALGVVALAMAIAPMPALANHQSGWTHDHSPSGVPYRPNGYSQLVQYFGQPCNGNANAGRSYWPSAASRGSWGYVNYHSKLVRNVGYNILGHYGYDHKYAASDYGVYGQLCRYIDGTTKWSAHAWGAAIDTNTARNPVGGSTWDGHGSDGKAYGSYIPQQWTGHNWQWGKAWNDPHHFQYVTGY